MSQSFTDELRRSLINTQYNQALRDPQKAEYIRRFQLQQCDENLIWIVDYLISPTSPNDSSRSIFELFYQTLLSNLQRASREMQFNSLEFNFTQRPPTVVRDIISMCAYLEIDIESPYVWLAMVAMSLGTPLGWVSRDGEYVNTRTGETLEVHPADMILEQWKDRKIGQTGSQLIMRLTEEEQAKVGESFIVVYDFKELKTKFVGRHDLFQPDLISIQLADEEVINQQIFDHIELAGALIEANEIVFQGASGDVVVSPNRDAADEMDTVMQTYYILEEENKHKAASKYVKKQGYDRQRKMDCQQNHYLLKFQQSLLPDVQLTREFVKEKLLPAPVALSQFIGYSCVSQRHYKLIVQNEAPVLTEYINPVHSTGFNIQMRLIVNISQTPFDSERFSNNSTLSLGNVRIFNELNGFPYPFENKGEAEPEIYDFMIGKSVSCRGVVFIIKQIGLETRKWLKECGRVFSKLGKLVGCPEDLGSSVAAGQICLTKAVDQFIKMFYQARTEGKELYAAELAGLAESVNQSSLILTM